MNFTVVPRIDAHMTTEPSMDENTKLPPDEAFDIVGDEVRSQVLRALGEADEPLSYSELLDRIEYDSTNFHYHLDKLVGHFIRKTEAGYVLRQAGGRVVKAILSGAVTEYPILERTPVETPCFLCGGTLEMSYRQEIVGLFCTDCGGTRTGTSDPTGQATQPPTDIVGALGLPPAGIYGRTPSESLRAAEIWTISQGQAVARDVCPWCSASLEHTVSVCENHDPSQDHCDECDHRFGVHVHIACSNCIFEQTSIVTARLLSNRDVMTFMLNHGIDPISPDAFHLTAKETIHSTDPLEVSFTFTADSDTLTVTVGQDLSVEDVTKGQIKEPGE